MKSIVQFNKKQLAEATNGEWKINNYSEDFLVSINTDSRTIIDNNNDESQQLFLALRGDNFDGHSFVATIITEGVCAVCIDEEHFKKNHSSFSEIKNKTAILVVKDTLQAYLDIAKYYRQQLTDLKVVAITGSCGKTSSKEMLKSICQTAYGDEYVYATKANTNNHIGVPQNILNINKECQVAILELGTSSPGEIIKLSECCRPDIALVTIIGHGHLEELKSIEGVAKEKGDIFAFMDKKKWAIIPHIGHGHNILIKKSKAANLKQFAGEYDKDADYMGKIIDVNLHGSVVKITDNSTFRSISCQLPFQGEHQLSNAVGVFAVAKLLGIEKSKIAQGFETSKNVGLRMKISEHSKTNATFINDAYNANFESMSASLQWVKSVLNNDEFKDHNCFLVLGDMLELGEHAQKLHSTVLKIAIDNFVKNEDNAKIFLIGENFYNSYQQLDLKDKLDNKIKLFSNSELAKEQIKNDLNAAKNKKILFLKGSRGIKLELIEEYCQ